MRAPNSVPRSIGADGSRLVRLALKIALSLAVAMVTLEAASAIVGLLGGHGNPYTTQRRRQIADELDRAIVNTPGRNQDDEQPLLAGRGIMYLHLLQPNQYFAGSKPLTDHERKAFAAPGSIYHDPLSAGYSHLLREAEFLEESGVDFVDLSRIFADHPEELYVDDCCHVNAQGNQILGEAMARLICERLSHQADANPASPR